MHADYKPNSKILKPGSIPSRFPNYPPHKIPVPAISRRQIEKQSPDNQVCRKRKRSENSKEKTDAIVSLNAVMEAGVQTEDDVFSKLKALEKEPRSQKTKTWRLNMKLKSQERKIRVMSERLAQYESNVYHKNPQN